MGTSENTAGVSFRDVAVYLSELRKIFGGHFSYTIALADRRDGTGLLSIVLERREHVVLSKCVNHPKRVWGTWPSAEHRTFAGLLLGLCHELDGKLGEIEQEAQRNLSI